MTKQDRILTAIENIITEFGQLRQDGIPADCWHRHMHDLRAAAWTAWHEQKKIIEKQRASETA